MTSSLRYATVGTGVVALAVLLSWPFLDPGARRGVVAAALVALPVQIASFALMQRFRGQVDRFLIAWVGGTVLRMLTIGFVAFVVVRSGSGNVMPTLVALASFFFGLLLLEPIYFRGAPERAG